MTRVYALDDPVQLGVFGARTLVKTVRTFECLSGPRKGVKSGPETAYHASSVALDDAHGVGYFEDAVRRQWAVESKYHARRDGTYCEDMRTRRCDGNVIGAMMLARSVLFVFFARSGESNCQAFKERMQASVVPSFRFVTGKR